MQRKKYRFFKSATILFIIASLLVCIACSVSESNRFYFATTQNGESTFGTQYLASSPSFQYDFAGEETLRNTSTTFSSLTRSIVRIQRNNYLYNIIFTCFLICELFFLKTTLCSYSYADKQKPNFASLRIARFIEQSDGKK